MQLNSSSVVGSSIRGLTVFVLVAASACAQVSASLSGTVTDPSGAALSGSGVTAKNVDTGAVRRRRRLPVLFTAGGAIRDSNRKSRV